MDRHFRKETSLKNKITSNSTESEFIVEQKSQNCFHAQQKKENPVNNARI